MSEIRDFWTEFAVVAKEGSGTENFCGFRHNYTREEVDEYLDWLLTVRRPLMEQEMIDNEASNYRDGNAGSYNWHNPRTGEKHRMYRIVQRQVGPWLDV